MSDMIHPISTTNARDTLRSIIRDDERFLQIPTRETAEQIANDIYRERKLYISTDYLLEVWMEEFTK